MTPDQLQPSNFQAYPPEAQAFAVKYLPLLRQLPLAVCPSFLAQIALLDTRFPAERSELAWQCSQLSSMETEKRDRLLAPLQAIRLPAELETVDWVGKPEIFVERLSAVLWADGQINGFHRASRELLDSVPIPEDTTDRLLLIVLGQAANTATPHLMRKLAKQGLRLEGFQAVSAQAQMLELLHTRSVQQPELYAHWYVDGGAPWPVSGGSTSITATSYEALRPLRETVLQRMHATIRDQQSNAEDLRTVLAGLTPSSVGGTVTAADPVLQLFYTQLFTQGSGTQIFSTSFVQWAGRELARRAKPKTVLLRYGLRQRYRGLNEMFEQPAERQMDAEGSLGDAEMDAFYNWIEMGRITSAGRLTTLVWAEGSSRAVLIGPKTRAGTVSQQPITALQAVRAMHSA